MEQVATKKKRWLVLRVLFARLAATRTLAQALPPPPCFPSLTVLHSSAAARLGDTADHLGIASKLLLFLQFFPQGCSSMFVNQQRRAGQTVQRVVSFVRSDFSEERRSSTTILP